jgi:hypothetical protein
MRRMSADHEHIPGEIEVTPEMIQAGIDAMSPWADYDDLAEEVYRAMERERRRQVVGALRPLPNHMRG